MWSCPKCNREFGKEKQTHSCKSYALEEHLKNKPVGKALFDEYIALVKEKVGPIKIESLPCCIHLVSDFTFGAVWVLKDKIKIDFRLRREVKIAGAKIEKISANRYMYYIDIKDKKEITDELLALVKESYSLHNE